MNKILRYSFVALLAMVFAPSFAEDIIWQEDFSSYAKDAVPTGGTYNYVCEGTGTKIYDANLAGGTSPELLVGKNGGSFSATISLNGKSGDMKISFLTNRDDLKFEVTGGTLGENEGPSNKSRIYPISVPSGTESLTVKFYMSTNSNARLDNIKLYQGTAKKPAGLSWGKASTSVTYGGDYSNIPTLQNPNNLSVVCTSNKEEVCTVTNAGVITVVGAGNATITAEFAGNDEYEAQSVSIEITVNPAVDPNAKGQKNNPYLLTDTEFISLINSLNTDAKPISDEVYVKGFITNVEEVSTSFGNATFKIAAVKADYDADMKLKAFRCNYLQKAKFTSEDQIKKDDEVVVCGKIQWFGEGDSKAPQINQGCYIYSLNGETTNINTIKTDADANAPAYNLAGQKVDKSYKGVVIMNGKKMIQK